MDILSSEISASLGISAAPTATLQTHTAAETILTAVVIQSPDGVVSGELLLQQAPRLGRGWTFADGLLLGQFSVIIVILIFTRFFIFAEATPSAATPALSRGKDHNPLIYRSKTTPNQLNPEPTPTSTILEKTYYNVESHAPESLDWLNVLGAQLISRVRDEVRASDNIVSFLNTSFAQLKLPEYLDTIRVTEVDLGDDFPLLSNCRIGYSSEGADSLEAKIDVDLSDTLTLGVETRLLLNYPKALMAVLPVLLSVSVVRFSGCLAVSMAPQSSESVGSVGTPGNGTALRFSFQPDYRLEFDIKSLIGSRSKLENVPKIGQLIESKLRSWFVERFVAPNYKEVGLPKFWPSGVGAESEVSEAAGGTGGTGGVGGVGVGSEGPQVVE